MNKLLKSKKALSPVVAAIILIAVTVAVSIAVAVWMGSLTFNFMDTEPVTITSVQFTGTSSNTINVTMINTGTTNVLINAATVTGYGAGSAVVDNSPPITIANDGASHQINMTLTGTWSAGNLYTIELISSKGNKYTYTETA